MLDHLINPDEPSKYEEWVEKRADERLDELLDIVAMSDLPDWFDSCIDWDSVRSELYAQAIREYEEMKAEAEISAWEDRQAAQDAECFGW